MRPRRFVNGLPVYVAAVPGDEDVDYDWLVEFYESEGFVLLDGEGEPELVYE